MNENQFCRFLDFDDIKRDDIELIPNHEKGENEEENEEEKKKDSFEPNAKMNTFVGFLRLANYVCAATVMFGLAVSLFYPRHPDEPEPTGVRCGQLNSIVFVKISSLIYFQEQNLVFW